MSMKNPLTPAGIEPATFRFVAQHLNHCATAVPLSHMVYSLSDRWDGNGVKMGTDKNFSGLLNFGGEINGKHPTWNNEEQTESYNLRTDFMRIAVCWCLMASFGVNFPQPQE